MSYIKISVVACSALILSACAAVLPSQEKLIADNNIPSSFVNSAAISEISSKAKEDTPLDAYANLLHIFQDETLKQLISEALAKNTDLLTLVSKIEQAKAEARKSGASMLPTVNIGTDYSVSGGASTQNQLKVNASLAWEVDIFGKLNNARMSSKERIEFARQNFENSKISLMGEVATYYFKLRTNAISRDISRKTLANLQQTLQIYEEKLKFGLIDETEVITARSDILNEENTLTSLETEHEQNKNALLVLLDAKTLQFGSTAQYSLPSPELPKITALPAEVILNRPDVRALIFSLNSQYYSTASANAALLPSLSLNASIGQVLVSSSGVGDLVWQLAASLTAPLLNRTNLYQNLKIQEEAQKQAEYSLKKTVGTALSEIESAAYAMKTSADMLSNSEKYLSNATETYKILQSKNTHGLIDAETLYKSENQMLSAQKNVTNYKESNINAAIILYKAFGGSFSKPQTDGANK